MNKTISLVLVIVIIIAGGYFLLKNKKVEAPAATTGVETRNTVIYTDAGYEPGTLTVKLGETVAWKNESSSGMWTASGVHPSHTLYSGTSLSEHCLDVSGTAFDACGSTQPGDSWSFTFNKTGTWKYHNHLKASHLGTIVVE